MKKPKQPKTIRAVEKKFTKDWRQVGVLIKPRAGHTNNLCIVCTKKVKSKSVLILDKDKEVLWGLPLRSNHTDDVYETNKQADKYPSPIWVRVLRKTLKGNLIYWDLKWRNPLKRSDGKSGEGNF